MTELLSNEWFAQLRDLLAAKDSAVAAKEDEDGGIRFPERAEADGFAEGVGEREAGEPVAEGVVHGGHHSGEKGGCQGRIAMRTGFMRMREKLPHAGAGAPACGFMR
jgi:hypothetical protein